MKNILKLTSVALMVSLAAGCSSSGGSGGGSEQGPDVDAGFENIDPHYGAKAPDADVDSGYEKHLPDGDSGYENVDPQYGAPAPEAGPGFDLGYIYIPDLDINVPVPSHPIEIDAQNPSSKMAAVKERSTDDETLYSIYIGERRVGEIIVNDEGISVEALHHDKTITATKNSDEDSWQVRGDDGNVKGDVKRLEDGTWLIREEITREVYVSVIKNGERIFIPASEVKGAIKDKIKGTAPKARLHKVHTLKTQARPKMG